MEFIWFILIGLVAGWLAGQFMKGGGFGIIGASDLRAAHRLWLPPSTRKSSLGFRCVKPQPR